MKKHITNFLILFLCLLGLIIFYDNQCRESEVLQQSLSELQNLSTRVKNVEKCLSEFNDQFAGKKLLRKKHLTLLIKKLSELNNVKVVVKPPVSNEAFTNNTDINKIRENKVDKTRVWQNKISYKFRAKRASDIISVLKCLTGKEFSLALIPSKIFIEKKSHQEYLAEVEFILPIVRKIKFKNIDYFKGICDEKLRQIANLYNDKFGISMFNQNYIFEGIVNDTVIINGVWLPKNYEDENFISTMIDNCTIMLMVKRFQKTFQLKQNKKESAY